MSTNKFENVANQSLAEKKEAVYENFLDRLKGMQSMDEFRHVFSSATDKLGELQQEAAETESEFDLIFRNGFRIDELGENIKKYHAAKADELTIDQFTTDRKREEINDRLQTVKTELPEEVMIEIDRVVHTWLTDEVA